MVIARMATALGNYRADDNAGSLSRIIVAPARGDEAGQRGAIALGLAALTIG